MAVAPKFSKKAKDLKQKADQAYTQQKWKKALEFYREASQEFTRDARMEQRMGDLLRRLEMKDDAIAQYKKVADMYASDGFWAKAIAVSKLILELDPNEKSVIHQLAQMYSNQGTKEITQPQFISPTVPQHDPNQFGYDMVGATLSVSGLEPRTMEDAPMVELEEKDLVSEVDHFTGAQLLGPPWNRLAGIPLFSDMKPDELMSVVERLAIRRYPQGALVCEEGDAGRSMFIIAEGVVDVFTKQKNGEKLILARLSGGEFFGEFGLLTNGQRNASVQAQSEVEVLEITDMDFRKIESRHPRIWIVLEDYLRKRLVSTILAKSHVFQVLSESEKALLTSQLSLRKVKAGDVVMAEGTAGDEMFFIKQGTVLVTANQGKDRIMIGELHSGDYFGEVAMLTGKNRTATVTAKVDAELFCLGRRDAAGALKANREVLLRLKTKMDERAKETQDAFVSLRESKNTLELV